MSKLKVWKYKIQQFIYSRKISTKMSVLMISVITLTLFCTVFIFQTYNKRILYKNMREAAVTNLAGIHSLVENTIENINTYSYICLSNSAVQQGLEKDEDNISDFRNIEKIKSSLTELIAKIDLVESIYIFDKENLLCYSDKSGNHPLLHSEIKQYGWYGKVKQNGEYRVLYRCREFFQSQDKIPGISFVRAVRSLDSMQTIGYMVIHVSQEAVDELLLKQEENEISMRFHIFSDRNHVLADTLDKSMQEEVENLGTEMEKEGKTSVISSIGRVRCLVSLYQTEGLDYIGVIPLEDYSRQEKGTVLLTVGLFVVWAVIVIIAALFTTHWYTRPVKRLLESMEEVKKGQFKRIELKTNHYEVQNLIDGYNDMLTEIEDLLDRTKQVERQKRKADLEVLSIQMNPHFLYNTFDSIKSLFLLNRYDDAYEMMCRLAQFYKISLSKGDQRITIEKEVQMTANYVEIQKMRYGEALQVTYDIDEKVKEYKILKLVLQPLVENAISHGIHGFVEEGCVDVQIKEDRGFLCLSVEDNGIGMSERRLSQVLSGENTGNGKSFGLMGTIRRLMYCYGDEMTYEIASRVNQGTRIRISIPVKNL